MASATIPVANFMVRIFMCSPVVCPRPSTDEGFASRRSPGQHTSASSFATAHHARPSGVPPVSGKSSTIGFGQYTPGCTGVAPRSSRNGEDHVQVESVSMASGSDSPAPRERSSADRPAAGDVLPGWTTRAVRALGRLDDRTGGRAGHSGDRVANCAAPTRVGARRARPRTSLRGRRLRHPRRHLRRAAGTGGIGDGSRPRAACDRRRARCGTSIGSLRPAVASPTGGGTPGRLAARPASFDRARRPCDQSPLRRRQRLLPARARAQPDVLLRSLRRTRVHPRTGAGRQVRPDLPQARAARAARAATARRRVRLGIDGDVRRRAPTARTSSASRSVASRRISPAAGSPTPAWRTASRSGCRTTASSVASGSTRSRRSACSSTSGDAAHGRVLHDAARPARRSRPLAQPRDLVGRRIEDRRRVPSSAATCSPTVS